MYYIWRSYINGKITSFSYKFLIIFLRFLEVNTCRILRVVTWICTYIISRVHNGRAFEGNNNVRCISSRMKSWSKMLCLHVNSMFRHFYISFNVKRNIRDIRRSYISHVHCLQYS